MKTKNKKMEASQKQEKKDKVSEVKTFPVPFALGEIKESITINTYTSPQNSKEILIKQAIQLHIKGNIQEATKYYQYFINQGYEDHKIFSNYGAILKDLGKLNEAELLLKKSIEINANFSKSYYNLGSILRERGKLKEAELSTRKAIELNPNYEKAYSSLGSILSDIGNLQEAELSTRKAIQLDSNFIDAHYNLGCILRERGKLKEAELSMQKAIELKPDFAKAYYSLSTLHYSNENKKWKDQLFSKNIINNKSKKEQVDIFFARANILHKEKDYKDSAKYLQLANKLKLILNPSQAETLINKSKRLLIESDKQGINQKKYAESPQSIFIVGMPRSGSTLLESILSMNSSVDDLGESNILEESFLENKKDGKILTIAERYWGKIKYHKKQSNTTTNKDLYNYLYAGIIAKKIPNAKIIHCYRNPLDNILSIYRTHFARGNEYSSSLVDCAKVYLNQENIMTNYKKRFRSKIYNFNYDSLVINPNQEIKYLISWLGWEWNDSYLSPHLNPRSVSTASSIQVRSPIHSKSIGGWKNYKDMLKSSIQILTKNKKYRNITR